MLGPFGLGEGVGILLWLVEDVDFRAVVPERVRLRVLFLNKLIIGDVSCKEGVSVGFICAFGDVSKAGTKFILCVFSRYEATITRDLRTWVGC